MHPTLRAHEHRPPAADAPAPPSHMGLARARDHLRAHATTTLTLDELARLAGLSKYHFLRVFVHAYGASPHEYQMALRLELASRLIAEGRPLAFVAYDAGFADQSHLTRRFKERYGMTPGTYRQLACARSAA